MVKRLDLGPKRNLRHLEYDYMKCKKIWLHKVDRYDSLNIFSHA